MLCDKYFRCFVFALAVGLLCFASAMASDQPADYDSEGRLQFHEGMITVKVKDGVGPFARQEGLVAFGIESLDEIVSQFGIQSLAKRFRYQPLPHKSGLPDLTRIYRVTFPRNTDINTVVAAFARDSHVEYAEPVPRIYVAEVPNDALYTQQQHLPQIQAEEAWDIHCGEDGTEPVVVAIVDTGVEFAHPDLANNVWQNLGEDADGDGSTIQMGAQGWELDPGDVNRLDDDGNGFIDDLIGWDFHNENEEHDNDPTDQAGHGTHCAGIASGVTNNAEGIASISWNVEIMITKHNNNDPPGEIVDGFDGILYAAQNGADIISCSWGTRYYSQAYQEVIQVANGLGSIVVAAAHNQDKTWTYFPAAWPGVISVAAVDSADVRTSYSNYGWWVDISGPGGDAAVDGGILSTMIGASYGRLSGTSMATPMVAGLMALVKSYHPEWTNEQIVTQVLGTADDLDTLNPSYENMLGAGRINAYRALSESGVLAQELRITLVEASYVDADGDEALEPGEVVTLNFDLRNYAHYLGDPDAVFTLTCDDPDVTILTSQYVGPIPPDAYFSIDDQFQFEISAEATSHETTLTLVIDSDLDVIFGQEIDVHLLLAPAGILVWEGIPDGQDHSGIFIRDTLEQFGLDVMYTNNLPISLMPFDAVFISQGNVGEFLEQEVVYTTDEFKVEMIEYLEQGGNMYYEYGSFLGGQEWIMDPRLEQFEQLFCVSDHYFGYYYPEPINFLKGMPGTAAENQFFTESTQVSNWYIDVLTPDENGTVAFLNEGYGNVAVQGAGEFGQKTFLFGYSISDLVDNEVQGTRARVLYNLAVFFGLPVDPLAAGDEDDLPRISELAGNYPNPFNPSTEIKYSLSHEEEVALDVYSVEGRLVRKLVHEVVSAGAHKIRWDGKDSGGKAVASGMYFVRLQTETAAQTRKMMLVR